MRLQLLLCLSQVPHIPQNIFVYQGVKNLIFVILTLFYNLCHTNCLDTFFDFLHKNETRMDTAERLLFLQITTFSLWNSSVNFKKKYIYNYSLPPMIQISVVYLQLNFALWFTEVKINANCDWVIPFMWSKRRYKSYRASIPYFFSKEQKECWPCSVQCLLSHALSF